MAVLLESVGGTVILRFLGSTSLLAGTGCPVAPMGGRVNEEECSSLDWLDCIGCKPRGRPDEFATLASVDKDDAGLFRG
jgi:hypothetical protein